MTRLLALFLAVMMVLSGCAGLGGDAVAPDAGSSGGSSGGSGSGSGGGGSGGGSSGGSGSGGSGADTGDGGADLGFQPAEDFEDIQNERQMADYIDRAPIPVFRPGEFYRYEGINGFGDTENPDAFVLTVESGEGGEWLEADVVVTVEKDDVVENSEESPALLFRSEYVFIQNGRAWIWLYRYNFVTERTPRISDLQVGDTWSYEQEDNGDEGEAVASGFNFEVTGSDSYAGMDCLLVETRAYEGEEERLFSETCVSPDIGMPLYYTFYQDDGDILIEATLVEYRR